MAQPNKPVKKGWYIILLLMCFGGAEAQVNVPGAGINFSALVRDSTGAIQALKPVKFRFTLLNGQNGTVASSPYIEVQNTGTDAYGFVNIVIGKGAKTGGTAATFANVDFSAAPYWLLVEIYNQGKLLYEPFSKTALQAVPYAKVAFAAKKQAVPTGTICAFAGDINHVPAGWLLCDGRSLDKTNPAYQALFAVIGTTWGHTVNNTNTFNLPNPQNRFLRGISSGSGVDPDAATRTVTLTNGAKGNNVGSLQTMAVQGHTHRIPMLGALHAGNTYSSALNNNFTAKVADFVGNNTTDSTYNYTQGNTAVSGPRAGSESRPKNLVVNYIIKL